MPCLMKSEMLTLNSEGLWRWCVVKMSNMLDIAIVCFWLKLTTFQRLESVSVIT
jgi:hypothetical protein